MDRGASRAVQLIQYNDPTNKTQFRLTDSVSGGCMWSGGDAIVQYFFTTACQLKWLRCVTMLDEDVSDPGDREVNHETLL